MNTKTIDSELIKSFYNGKVKIRNIKTYADSRGMVSEVFRTDSDITPNSKMCYISETIPFYLRGPHQHSEQSDFFYSWKTLMCYMFYDFESKKSEYFITDPTKITSVYVAPGIIHSYRNLSLTDAKTLNFPDQLFMGENKKGYSSEQKIDEIRHEESVKPSKNIWVLGAGGRLGKAITTELFENMGYHSYHVIPIYEKVVNNKDGINSLVTILKAVQSYKLTEDDIVINCIAKTNVQKDGAADCMFANLLIPKFLSEWALKEKINLLHFSTDYVYQHGIVSDYTKSKKMWEEWYADSAKNFAYENGITIEEFENRIKVIRLANLFSQDVADIHNVLNKLATRFEAGSITTSDGLVVMPTDVESISKYIAEKFLPNFNDYYPVTNLSGKPYNFKQLHKLSNIKTDLKVTVNDNPDTTNNPNLFLNHHHVELDCDVAIAKKFDTIITSKG